AIGRKKTIGVGAAAAFFSVAFYAIAQNALWLFVGAFFEGFAAALYSGNNDAFLYDHLKSCDRESFYKKYLGKTRSMSHVALSISGLTGALMLLFGTYSLLFVLTVIPKAVCVFSALFLNEPESIKKREIVSPWKHLRECLREVSRNKSLVKIIAADSIAGGAGESAYQFRATFIKMVWPTWAIGFATTLGDLIVAFSYWISEKWIHRRGNKSVIIIGRVYSILSNTVALIMGNIFSPVLLTSNALFHGVTEVAKNDIAQKLFTDRHRASMSSVKSLVESLVCALMALLIGVLADIFGVIPALISFQAFGLISLWLYMTLFKKVKARSNK
ncbi:MAG: MFS transporter, partial [Clostridiales bacterium]|nr:MFS transporter [Clostridiales bacterium]